jgi:hypothetical protein
MFGGGLPTLTIKITLQEDQRAVKVHCWQQEEVLSASVRDSRYLELIIGTDVAGSVRVPAHFSGIYTIKCTPGFEFC